MAWGGTSGRRCGGGEGVLSGCHTTNAATVISGNATVALAPSFSNMFFTVDSIVVPDAYNQLLRNQLAHSVLPLNYNEYYTFTPPQAASNTLTNRFNLASGSIDKLIDTKIIKLLAMWFP